MRFLPIFVGKHHILRHLAYIIIICASLFGCNRNNRTDIMPDNCRLRTGDIVFRKGNGMNSRFVTFADKEGIYSHVGIVVDSAGTLMIVHAVPDEPDFNGDPDRVKMESPRKFFSSINASAGEVRRFKGASSVARRAAMRAMQKYRQGTLFDHDYDDTDTTKMYCCELVEAAYTHAGITLAGGKRHQLNFPGTKGFKCILPSDIINSPELVKVISF